MAVQRGIIVALLLAATVAAAGPAHAADPSCGSAITADTTLTADLACTGDALIVTASGITLDLGGHTVSGPGSTFGGPVGVRLVPGAPGVRVRTGHVQGFWRGVSAPAGADRTDMSGLTLARNGFGISLLASHSVAHGNRFTGNGVAAEMRGLGNRFQGNALLTNEAGLLAFQAGDATILGNSIQGDGSHDPGIAVGLGARRVRVAGNSVSGTEDGSGIQVLAGGSDVDISHNHVFGNLDGISLFNSDARVVGNVVFSNLDDGIDVQEGGRPVIGANTAVRNGDLGINAPGAADAGGNRAAGNGNPLQCRGVACT